MITALDAGRPFIFEHPIAPLTMKHCRGAESIRGFLETAGTEKSVQMNAKDIGDVAEVARKLVLASSSNFFPSG